MPTYEEVRGASSSRRDSGSKPGLGIRRYARMPNRTRYALRVTRHRFYEGMLTLAYLAMAFFANLGKSRMTATVAATLIPSSTIWPA
jgi:hypothetical protein